jgi:hypothetical protein
MYVMRYLCSELVVLQRGDDQATVNLEEIWTDGAAIETDDVLAMGEMVELQCGGNRFPAIITLVAKHEFGCRVEMDFAEGVTWKPEIFHPQHMLDPQTLLGKKAES